MYEAVVKMRKVEDVDELRNQLAAAEKRVADLESELQRKDSEISENGPPPSRSSLTTEEMQLSLPPQDDTNIKDDMLLDSSDSPRIRKSVSENFSSPSSQAAFQPRARKVIIANDTTFLETPLLKSGTLYRNPELELSAKTTLVNSICYLTLVHRNCSNFPICDLCIVLHPVPDSSLTFSNGTVILQGCNLEAGTQGIELLQCCCSGVTSESPSIVVSYIVQSEYKEIFLKLPISVASFMMGIPSSAESIVKLYTSLAGHQSSCKFTKYKTKIINKEMLAGFVTYQKSFTVVNLGDAAEIGGVGELMDHGPVVFFIKKMEDGYELRCRGPDVQLRDAVLRFLIGLISA